MQENQKHPNDAQIGAWLRAAHESPALPPRFRENVWRRIEVAEAPEEPASWLDALVGLILRPRFAVAAVAVLLLAGVSAGMAQGWQSARFNAEMNYLAAVAPHAAR